MVSAAAFVKRGAILINDPDEAKAPGLVVIRAHGITDRERAVFLEKGLTVADATCPVVLRSQSLLRSSDKPVVVIGYAGHSEVVSLLGSASCAALVETPCDVERLSTALYYNAVVQTTFSLPELEAIKAKALQTGVSITILNTICRASMDRRASLSAIMDSVDALIVAGDSASRNTLELWNEAKRTGKPSFLVSGEEDIPDTVFSLQTVGLTAGASCPDTLIEGIRRRLEDA